LQSFHFLQEPNLIKVNDIVFAITSTDIIKDLTSITLTKSSSTDKISRNFSHLLKQRSFYPICPPPENISIDYEAWNKYARIDEHPHVFIAVSDFATFVKVKQFFFKRLVRSNSYTIS
jgi:DNA polymerase alpha subunit B